MPSRIHTSKILRLSMDLPIIIEVVAREGEIQAVLPELDCMIDGGLVTLERARVIMCPHQHDYAGLQQSKALSAFRLSLSIVYARFLALDKIRPTWQDL